MPDQHTIEHGLREGKTDGKRGENPRSTEKANFTHGVVMRGEPAGTEDPPAAEVDEDAEAEQIAEKLCSHTEDKGEMLQALEHIQAVTLHSPANLFPLPRPERTSRPFALMVPSSSIWLATVNFERSALRAFMSLMHSRPRAETFRIWIRQWSSIAARTPWENGLRFLIFSYSSTERDPFKFS